MATWRELVPAVAHVRRQGRICKGRGSARAPRSRSARRRSAPIIARSSCGPASAPPRLHDAGDHAAAEPVYRQAIKARKRHSPRTTWNSQPSAPGSATLLRQTGRPAEAELLYRLALAAREKGSPPGMAASRRPRKGSARTSRRSSGRPKRFLSMSAPSPYASRRTEPKALPVASVLSRLGPALLKLDRPAEAEPFLRRLAFAAREERAARGRRRRRRRCAASPARSTGKAAAPRPRSSASARYRSANASMAPTTSSPFFPRPSVARPPLFRRNSASPKASPC